MGSNKLYGHCKYCAAFKSSNKAMNNHLIQCTGAPENVKQKARERKNKKKSKKRLRTKEDLSDDEPLQKKIRVSYLHYQIIN
jgi:hypothetical protein